jgi:hypothetical protein
MKKLLLMFTAAAFFSSSMMSCAKCYVCKDKDSDTFVKMEICDKDFDKGDIDLAIRSAEDDGATCHRKTRIL